MSYLQKLVHEIESKHGKCYKNLYVGVTEWELN